MVIALGYLLVEMPESHSLKEKRSIVRPIIKRVQTRFNVSIAEIDNLDSWQAAGIGLACVSNSQRHADEMLQKIIAFVEGNLDGGYLAEIETDVMQF